MTEEYFEDSEDLGCPRCGDDWDVHPVWGEWCPSCDTVALRRVL